MKSRKNIFLKPLRIALAAALFLPYSLLAQNMLTISGTVTDDDNQPAIGVGVVLEGTTKGTATDMNGSYTIQAPADGTLKFSFTGMTDKQEPINGRARIDVAMSTATNQLDEVVVVGYGTMRKRDLTGSISSLKGDVIKQIPVASAAEALTGKLAGVQVTTTEGAPGADIKIRVRGGGSITQDNSPLYIIDGFPSESGMNAVDPSDIESIDVLKDASSTAIYGARGANGVVIITTKGGKDGKTSVTYDAYVGVKQLARKMEVMNPYEFSLWQYNQRVIDDDGRMTNFANMYGEWSDLYYNYAGREGIDWQDELFGRDALTQTHNLSINGGGKSTRFNLGYSLNKEQGTLINTGFKRNVAKMKFDHKAFNDKLAVSVNFNYSKRDVDGGGEYGRSGRLKDAMLYRPTMGINYTDEQLLFMDEDETSPGNKMTNLFNPVKTQQSEYRFRNNTATTANASLDYEIVKGLNFKVMGGFSDDYQTNEEENGPESKSAKLAARGEGTEGIWAKVTNRKTSKWSNTNTLTYKVTIKDDHDVNLMLGNEQVSTVTKRVETSSYMFPDVGVILDNLSLGTRLANPVSANETNNLMSFFGRAFYGYKSKYLFTATLRADGSSKFHANNRWGVFPSVSGAWNVSSEEYVKNLSFLNAVGLSIFKLRASYGQAGNNRIDNDQYRLLYENGHYGLDDQQATSVYPTIYANPNLKWETTISRNVGLDWGIFNGRLGGSVDWYMNDTRDLLLKTSVSSVSSYTSQIQNVGSTRNQGVEFVINAIPVKKSGFIWSVDFNISFNKNEIISLGNGMTEIFYATGVADLGSSTTDYIVKVGQSVGTMYGYVSDGYYKLDEFELDANAAAQKANERNAWLLKPDNPNAPSTDMYGMLPGAIKFKDLNGDGVITPEDRTIIGSATPKHFGGLNNTFTWKGFDLSIFLNWVYGNDVYNANKLRFTVARNRDENALVIMNDAWKVYDGAGNDIRYNAAKLAEVNANAKYWRPVKSDSYFVNSWVIEDGSFLRINNLTFGYTLPDRWLKKLSIQKLRVYGTMNNLYVFTKYSGYDPEVDTQSSAVTPNTDYSAYPRSKTYILGLNFAF